MKNSLKVMLFKKMIKLNKSMKKKKKKKKKTTIMIQILDYLSSAMISKNQQIYKKNQI